MIYIYGIIWYVFGFVGIAWFGYLSNGEILRRDVLVYLFAGLIGPFVILIVLMNLLENKKDWWDKKIL